MNEIEINEWMSNKENSNKFLEVFNVLHFNCDNVELMSFIIKCINENMAPEQIIDRLLKIEDEFSDIVKKYAPDMYNSWRIAHPRLNWNGECAYLGKP